MPKTVQIITLGCPKNEVDSEVTGSILDNAGYEILKNEEPASIVYINTCGFIEDAKKESIDQIIEAIERKKAGEIKKIYIAGCLVQRYEKDLKELFKNEIDGFFSVTDYENIKKSFKPKNWIFDHSSRYRLSADHFAYLKISEGCNYRCSFCAIPSIRGNMQSRSIVSLVDEAKHLVEGGAKELIVISEDITKYGKDLLSEVDLCTLLVELENIPDLKWIRLMYAYPGTISERLIEIIGDSKKICKYIDIPIQHISDQILNRMNRAYGRKEVEYTIDKLRSQIPGITLRSSVIVGFPGETKDHFVELSDFLSDIQFERLGVFCYSDEEGTEAAGFDNKIEPNLITERYDEIRFNHDSAAEKQNRKKIGKKIVTLVDSIGENSEFIGRTEADAPEIDHIVRINRNAVVGEFTTITVEDSATFELIGK